MGTKGYVLGASLLGVCIMIAAAAARARSRAAEVRGTAKELCFSCHGDDFHGGRAPQLAGGHWIRASTNQEAARVVREGLPDLGMPAFGEKIPSERRDALISFICAQPRVRNASSAGVDNSVIHTKKADFRIEPFVRGLEVPWSMAFLAPDRMLVTERIGQLR